MPNAVTSEFHALVVVPSEHGAVGEHVEGTTKYLITHVPILQRPGTHEAGFRPRPSLDKHVPTSNAD
jgi:hypothetical protein